MSAGGRAVVAGSVKAVAARSRSAWAAPGRAGPSGALVVCAAWSAVCRGGGGGAGQGCERGGDGVLSGGGNHSGDGEGDSRGAGGGVREVAAGAGSGIAGEVPPLAAADAQGQLGGNGLVGESGAQ